MMAPCRFRLALSLFSALLMPGLAHSSPISSMAFWRTQPTLVITTTTQSVPAGDCSGTVTVRTKNAVGVFANVTSNLTVNLATSGSMSFYSDANCATPITAVTITTGNSSANFYFLKTDTTTETITATALSYAAATQTENGLVNAYVWTGGGSNANWSTGANWSGGVAPGTSNQALFNGTCSSNCSPIITANINVGGIRIASGYTGTITQNTGVTITTGSSGWYQTAGTFAGGDSAINIGSGGPFALTGGTFTSTSGTLAAGNEFLVSNTPTFNHNNGKVTFNAGNVPTISGVGSINFFNVDVLGQGSWSNVTLNGNMNVLGSLRILDFGYGETFLGTGTISVSQNLEIQGSVWSVQSSIKIKMVGTGTITGSGAGSHFGALEIATAGTITFASTGSVDISGDFTYTSGTVVTTGSTVRMVGGTQTVTPGSIAFNNFSLYVGSYNANTTINGTLTVLGDLTLNCYNYTASMSSGTINVSGNLNIVGGQFYGGTTLIRMVGTGTITGSGSGAYAPNLEIATSGTITFANTGSIDIGGNFTYTSGTVVTTGSTVRFTGYGQTVNSGSMAFNNLTFYQGTTSANTITGTVYVNGNLSLIGTNYWPSSNGGTIQVNGNLSVSGTWTGGTTSLVLAGSGVQTMTGSTAAHPFPGSVITVNNASSVLTLGSANVLGASQGIAVTAGSVDMAGYALTTKSLSLNGNTLTKNSGVLTVNGSVAGTGSLYGGTVNP